MSSINTKRCTHVFVVLSTAFVMTTSACSSKDDALFASGGSSGSSPAGLGGDAGTGGAGASGTSGAGGSAGAGATSGAGGLDASADAVAIDAVGSDASSSSSCDTYIACVAQAAPGDLDSALAAYGKTGSCWQQGDPSLCSNACRASTIEEHKAFPSADACNICNSASDCPASEPACAQTGKCVGCLSDNECQPPLSACAVDTHTCVKCTQDSQCKGSSEGSHCAPATHTCVACVNNADCFGGPLGPICTNGTCHPCKSDSECSPGVCFSGSCVQCKDDTQCPSAKPYCLTNNLCVACLSNTDCSPGICMPSHACCGKDACTNQSADCGDVIDWQCPLASITCGGCGSGQLCLNNLCSPIPAKTCSNQSCSSGFCGYVPGNNDYECVVQSSVCSSSTSCDPGYSCDSVPTDGGWSYFCVPYCVTSADCPGGQCVPLDSTAGYGTCK